MCLVNTYAVLQLFLEVQASKILKFCLLIVLTVKNKEHK